ncbi:hypothetical protein RSAG8_00550, partial [Rhizoctonia solani AG-8 WAC10335]
MSMVAAQFGSEVKVRSSLDSAPIKQLSRVLVGRCAAMDPCVLRSGRKVAFLRVNSGIGTDV